MHILGDEPKLQPVIKNLASHDFLRVIEAASNTAMHCMRAEVIANRNVMELLQILSSLQKQIEKDIKTVSEYIII